MPNKKSAEKRVRIAERNRLYNRYWTSRCKTAVKKVHAAVEAGDKNAASEVLKNATSTIEKAATKGVLHKNTAAHKVSQLTKAVNAMA